jgi:hypothetical protein
VKPSDTGDGHDRLLDGEDPATKSHAVATRWVRVYSDLIRAKVSLLADLKASRARSTPQASFELAQVDGRILAAQRARYERRLTFWKRRQRELVGSTTT